MKKEYLGQNNKALKVSEVQVIYKSKVKSSERYKINSSVDAYKILKSCAFDVNTIEYKESFKLILLNTSNQVLGITTISEGGMDNTVVDVKLILQTALLTHSSAIIIAHNHPSGNISPSRDDLTTTQYVKEAAKLLNINLLDHLIVSKHSYYSFVDEGQI